MPIYFCAYLKFSIAIHLKTVRCSDGDIIVDEPTFELTTNFLSIEELNAGKVVLRRYTGLASYLEIPTYGNELASPFYGYKIVQIMANAFEGNKTVQTVVLPESIEILWYHAFAWSSVETVVIKNPNIQIPEGAFSNSNVTTIEFYGTKEQWGSHVKLGKDCKVICLDGVITVDGKE